MSKHHFATAAMILLPVLFFTPACEGPAGACEDTAKGTCTDGKKANCEWTEGKLSKEEAEKMTKEHKFHEGKTCSDVGFTCTGGICKKK